jgi:hypothetical protein
LIVTNRDHGARARHLTGATHQPLPSPAAINQTLTKNPRPGLRPGACKGKAHRPEHLGYAGQRVLTSRKWSGKTLADHRADKKARLLATLGMDEPDPSRYTWHVVTPDDHDYLPYDKRLLYIVADRTQLKAALDEARRRSQEAAEISATGEAA